MENIPNKAEQNEELKNVCDNHVGKLKFFLSSRSRDFAILTTEGLPSYLESKQKEGFDLTA